MHFFVSIFLCQNYDEQSFWKLQKILKPKQSYLVKTKLLVSRVWPILTRSLLRQQARASGAGALKPLKNRNVRPYTMGTTAQTKTIQNLRGNQRRFLRHLRII